MVATLGDIYFLLVSTYDQKSDVTVCRGKLDSGRIHRIVRLLRLAEAKPHSDPLAKKMTAFFRMPRLCHMRSTSRRRTFSSSIAGNPLAPRGIRSACKAQRLSVV